MNLDKHLVLGVNALLGCALLWSAAFSAQAAEPGKNPNIVRWAEGEILYRTIEAQRPRANESWRLNVHPDGSRTMIGYTDNFDAENSITMVHRVAADFRPLESMVTYWSKGQFNGVGLFTVRGNTLSAAISGPLGTVFHKIDVPEGFSIVPHPLATDSWHFWYYDKAEGGAQTSTIYNPQVAPRTGVPVLGHLETNTMTFEGEEEVSVPAGTFETDHYRLGDDIHVWMTGPDKILVRYAFPSFDLEYILMSLKTGSQ